MKTHKNVTRIVGLCSSVALAMTIAVYPASADTANPGQSMTHMKTAPGLSSTLEGAGVVFYVQGGATSAVMGESIASPDGQVVFHIPVTGSKGNVRHVGSNIVIFNTTNNKQVQLRNPVIDLKRGVVLADIPQASVKRAPVLSITNAKTLKPKVTTTDGIRSTVYTGAQLSLAPGVGPTLDGLLGLPAGSLPDGAAFGSADVTVNAKATS